MMRPQFPTIIQVDSRTVDTRSAMVVEVLFFVSFSRASESTIWCVNRCRRSASSMDGLWISSRRLWRSKSAVGRRLRWWCPDPKNRFQAVGRPPDQLLAVRRPNDFLYLFGGVPSLSNTFRGWSRGKQERIPPVTEDYLFPEEQQYSLSSEIYAVNQDPARCRVDKIGDTIDQGRFAGPSGAYNGYRF